MNLEKLPGLGIGNNTNLIELTHICSSFIKFSLMITQNLRQSKKVISFTYKINNKINLSIYEQW